MLLRATLSFPRISCFSERFSCSPTALVQEESCNLFDIKCVAFAVFKSTQSKWIHNDLNHSNTDNATLSSLTPTEDDAVERNHSEIEHHRIHWLESFISSFIAFSFTYPELVVFNRFCCPCCCCCLFYWCYCSWSLLSVGIAMWFW